MNRTTTSDFDVIQGLSLKENDASIEEKSTRFDTDYQIGLGCLLFSSTLFLVSTFQIALTTAGGAVFALSYLTALFYTAWLLGSGKLRWFWKKQHAEFIHHRLLLGYVWLVSCFALNQDMHIFRPSASWLMICVAVSGLSAIVYTWEESLPLFFRRVLFVVTGSSLMLWVYYSIYLLPLYPLSVPGLLALGLSIHTFIPLLLSVTYVRLLYSRWNDSKYAITIGALLPVATAIYFSATWYSINTSIGYRINSIASRPTDDLPDWVILARDLGNDWITRRVVMSDLAYQVIDSRNNSLLGNTFNNGELIRHDPFVLIASAFTGKLPISEDERIKIMEVLYDTRHETQERLWSGSSLRTANVLTQARIYPEVRVAYTEKTISIANQSSSSFWQEEALYTFYLPEGSVVSSLSLWINGVEEKSYLTTQSKADSAYRTIVGREARDPSVAHWQEGNTIKVKVFPCTSRENRKFKIGITSPLKPDEGSLVYENSWFKGPGASDATETIRLEFPENTVPPQLPFETTTSGSGFIVYEGKYQSSWNVRFKLMPLTHDVFSFNGKSYALEPLVQTSENFRAEAFYLDINQSWTKNDLDALWPWIKDRPVFVADERLIRLTSANKDELFKTLSAFHFSIFPTHRIPHPETALLVTKSAMLSPTLRDLAKSNFAKMLSRSNSPAVRAFIIGDEPSPYIKSLDELRIIRGEKTDWEKLKGFIARNQFPADPEKDPSVVRIDRSKTVIRELDGAANGQAPDHLLRLFAYNHIMQQVGGHYLDQSFQTDSILNAKLIGEAEAAHIVTPVSSMIVLESQRDYDRFDIRKSKNSLDNATLKSSGAVPEPHEWILIGLLVLIISIFTIRRYVC